MKIVFAGTPVFAAVALKALLDSGHEVTLVLTQPDRPAGRGLKPQAPAVKRLAEQRGLKVVQPSSLNSADVVRAVASASPDVIVVAAYGLILPETLLNLPPLGCLNIHASLLPRWRGAAPIQRALLAGDAVTGITIMQMDAGLDTGPIVLQESVPIAGDATAGVLHDELAALGACLIVRALTERPAPRPQDTARATYAARIGKGESEIDWRRPAGELERQVRAFNPSPGAYTQLGPAALKIWGARVEPQISGAPGTVCAVAADSVVVACGNGALRITELQRAGGKRLSAEAFLAGFNLEPGMCLGGSDG
ncbi:MAG: methionyl-tRNA formyltransferase [Betaproteobacteria bacterium]|nr:methionyl-tRNA formyltransferase [Betaproteobacteria bacterium]